MSDTPRRIYEFGPFRVDGVKRLLLREGNPVRLTAKAFDILLLLLEENGRLVEKDELMRRVWPDAVVEENNLTVNMSALRKSLGESPGEHRYLVTVPGRGYQFVAEVRQPGGMDGEGRRLSPGGGDPGSGPAPLAAQTNGASEIQAPPRSPDGAARFERPASAARTVQEVRRRGRGALLVVALFATTIVVAYFASSRHSAGSGGAGVRSIAVLPFRNVGNDADLEYLSDGISETLISRLSQLPGLKVIARDSAFRYKGTEVDLKEVAKALGVEAILTGRVTPRGETLSISVELVNASDKTQIWGEQYSRRATDLPAVQSEISREIADKLRLRLSAGERRLLAKSETVNPQAYEQLLRGRFYFNKGSSEARTKAVEHYERAIAVDPNYAPAYAELASAYSILGNDGAIDPKEAVRRAEATARRALELDEGLAEAHRAMAYTKQLAWDWAGAEREYKRAVELNPNDAEAHAGYSGFLSLIGRHDQAVAEAGRAKDLDPVSIRIDIWVFGTLYSNRRYDQALDLLEEMRELDPNHPLTGVYAGYTYAAMGRYPEAIAAYKEAMKQGGGEASGRIYLGYAYARAGQREEALAILSELKTTKQYVSPAELAVLYAGLGETRQAFLSLERAYEAHDVQLQYLYSDQHFDSLRGDPRFTDLTRRVGLAP